MFTPRKTQLRSEDAYVGAMLIGDPRPMEATRSSMQAAQTLVMTVPTQDDIGWTRLSHHGTAPAPPRGTPAAARTQCCFGAAGVSGGVTADG